MPSATRTAAPSIRSSAAARRSERRHPWFAALSGAALSLAAAGGTLAQQSFDVAMRDGLLTIRSNGSSAAELAAALAEETGVRFVVTGDTEQTITTEIVDEPLAKAVQLLSPNHLLMRAEGGVGAEVIEVVLMMDDAADGAGDGGGETEFLPSGAPADEVFVDDASVVPQSGDPGVETDGEGMMKPPMIGPEYLPPEGQLGPDGQPLVQ